MSIKDRSSVNYSSSLSQGEDYMSLLNDSVTEKYTTFEHLNNRPALLKSSPKDTLNYLEDDVNHLGQEVMNLRSTNCYLEAQIQILQKEKEMHIANHAKEKMKLESVIKELQNKLNNEQKETSKQIQTLKIKLQEFEIFLQEEQQKRINLVKKYKNKIENKEKEFFNLIKDKDKYIHQLQVQLEQGKCSRVCNFNPVHAQHKRNKSKKSVNVPSVKSFQVHENSKSESKLESISNMIVRMEREKADINQTMSELDFSQTDDRSKRNLQELMIKNEEKLREAKALQHSLLKEKFSSTFS